MVYVLFSIYIALYFTFFFFEAERADTKCVVLQGHTMCFIVPGFKECTIMFDCSQIYIIIYSVEYRTVVLYFFLLKNIWGKDFLCIILFSY